MGSIYNQDKDNVPGTHSASKLYYPITEKYIAPTTTSKELSSIDTSVIPGLSFSINSINKVGITEVGGTVGLSPNNTSVKAINRVLSDSLNADVINKSAARNMYAPTGAYN